MHLHKRKLSFVKIVYGNTKSWCDGLVARLPMIALLIILVFQQFGQSFLRFVKRIKAQVIIRRQNRIAAIRLRRRLLLLLRKVALHAAVL